LNYFYVKKKLFQDNNQYYQFNYIITKERNMMND